MSSKLPNYLRSNRKRLALSQDDVAFLLGVESGAMVSRHERFTRIPGLETILAYQVVFQKVPSELFAGLYCRIEGQVAIRAEVLVRRMANRKMKGRIQRKCQALAEIAALKNKGAKKKK